MKKFEIWTSEVMYTKYIVEAETKEDAIEAVSSGDEDAYDTEYEHYQVDSAEEIGEVEDDKEAG